jgi:hypothetical protein
LSSIENLTGSAFTDLLFGDGLANTLDGGGGTDVFPPAYAAALEALQVNSKAKAIRQWDSAFPWRARCPP